MDKILRVCQAQAPWSPGNQTLTPGPVVRKAQSTKLPRNSGRKPLPGAQPSIDAYLDDFAPKGLCSRSRMELRDAFTEGIRLGMYTTNDVLRYIGAMKLSQQHCVAAGQASTCAYDELFKREWEGQRDDDEKKPPPLNAEIKIYKAIRRAARDEIARAAVLHAGGFDNQTALTNALDEILPSVAQDSEKLKSQLSNPLYKACKHPESVVAGTLIQKGKSAKKFRNEMHFDEILQVPRQRSTSRPGVITRSASATPAAPAESSGMCSSFQSKRASSVPKTLSGAFQYGLQSVQEGPHAQDLPLSVESATSTLTDVSSRLEELVELIKVLSKNMSQ